MLENGNVKTASKASWVFLVLQLPMDSILVEFSIEAGLFFFASKAGGGGALPLPSICCACILCRGQGAWFQSAFGRMAVSCRSVPQGNRFIQKVLEVGQGVVVRGWSSPLKYGKVIQGYKQAVFTTS